MTYMMATMLTDHDPTLIEPEALYTLKDCAALTGRSYHQVTDAVERGLLLAVHDEHRHYQVWGADLIAWRDRVPSPGAFLEPVYRPVPPNEPPEPLTPDEIRAVRTRLGLTQSLFARRLGCSRSTVTDWETGRARPGKRTTMALRTLLAEGDLQPS